MGIMRRVADAFSGVRDRIFKKSEDNFPKIIGVTPSKKYKKAKKEQFFFPHEKHPTKKNWLLINVAALIQKGITRKQRREAVRNYKAQGVRHELINRPGTFGWIKRGKIEAAGYISNRGHFIEFAWRRAL